MANIELCVLNDLDDPGARGFRIDAPQVRAELFAVRIDKSVYVYRNSCPHTGGPLDWVPDQFLSMDSDWIQCATHAALFRIKDGVCVKGPCAGQSLISVAVEIIAGRVMVDLDALKSPS